MITIFQRTWSSILLVDIDAVNRRAAHVPRQVDVDGCHDAEDDAGLQHTNEVGRALALVLGHEVFPRLADEDVDVGEERAEHSADDAHEDGREDCDDVDGDKILGRELGLEEAEVVLVLESVEGGVEQVGGEGCDHATKENLPRKFVFPERRYLLHGKEEAAYWSPESRGYSGRGSGRNKISSVFRVSKSGEARQAALEGGGLELAHACCHQAAEMDHGALVADRHTAPDRKGAGEEFNDKGLNLEDVFDPGPV